MCMYVTYTQVRKQNIAISLEAPLCLPLICLHPTRYPYTDICESQVFCGFFYLILFVILKKIETSNCKNTVNTQLPFTNIYQLMFATIALFFLSPLIVIIFAELSENKLKTGPFTHVSSKNKDVLLYNNYTVIRFGKFNMDRILSSHVQLIFRVCQKKPYS